MTGKELYTLTKSIMFEPAESVNYDDYALANINRLIGELYNDNNMRRAFKGKSELKSIPFISDLKDPLLYEDEYTHDVMPKGLASYLMFDDDMGRYSTYHVDYLNAIQKYQCLL